MAQSLARPAAKISVTVKGAWKLLRTWSSGVSQTWWWLVVMAHSLVPISSSRIGQHSSSCCSRRVSKDLWLLFCVIRYFLCLVLFCSCVVFHYSSVFFLALLFASYFLFSILIYCPYPFTLSPFLYPNTRPWQTMAHGPHPAQCASLSSPLEAGQEIYNLLNI